MSAELLIKDWAFELLLLIDQAKAEAAAGDDFAKGRAFGLAQALSLFQEEAKSFGLPASSLGLPDEDAIFRAMRE